EARGGADFEAPPGPRQSPQKVTVGERDRRPLLPGEPAQKRPGAGIDLGRRLASRAAVNVDLPSRPPRPYVGAGQALVLPVIELTQEGSDRGAVEACELGGAERPLQGARVRSAAMDGAQHPTAPPCLLLPLRQQRQVPPAPVLPPLRPGGPSVAPQVKIQRQTARGSP